jgi:hypothetical protein
MAEPKYGAFESNPARFTDNEAWVYQHDNVWRKMNSGEVLHHAAVLSETDYHANYPDLPALPKTAFQPPGANTHPGPSVEKAEPASGTSSELTSAGVPWSEVPDFALPHAEWLDGRHGPPEDTLPPVDKLPIPEVLFAQPVLHPGRPRGAKAMADVHGARQRLANCRPGAWLISPYTGWRWAKWPNGEVGWLLSDTVLPNCLRVR